MWSSSGRPGVAAFPRGGRRWCGRGRRKRGGGRAARQRDQRGKRDVDLLHGPAGKHHRQQWVGRRRRLSCLVCSVTIPQTNSAPALQFSQLWLHICVWPCLCVRASSFQQLVGLQEAGLRPVLPRRSDCLPHCGSAPPLSRLLLGIHWHRSFCPPTGRQTIRLPLLIRCAHYLAMYLAERRFQEKRRGLQALNGPWCANFTLQIFVGRIIYASSVLTNSADLRKVHFYPECVR